VKDSRSPLKVAEGTRKLKTSKVLHLCSECHTFLVRGGTKCKPSNYPAKQWSYMWPAFYWDLLTGEDTSTEVPFHQTYDVETLWRFIPETLRKYWIETIRSFQYDEEFLYRHVSVNFPKSHFLDCTADYQHFWSDIKEYTFKGMLQALDPQRLKKEDQRRTHEDLEPESKILPDVLCPWGCSEFLFRTKGFDPSLVLQNHLRFAQLNIPGTTTRCIRLKPLASITFGTDRMTLTQFC